MDRDELIKYGKYYTESGFWSKLRNSAGKAGCEIVKNALILFYAISNASPSEKAIIIGALGYFILPFDLFPDLIPVTGYTDDANWLAFAIKEAKNAATPQVIAKAERTVKEWFG
jgi:uncharacterized membrane protein YkvA (DUF1232 family)